MGRVDPFYGYGLVLRLIVFAGVPLFALSQVVRLRRALHVLQLEGYKSHRFLDWVRAESGRRWFLARATSKKPLVMTGRAWRILTVAAVLSVASVLLAPAAAHLWLGGWPADVLTWVVVTVVVGGSVPRLMVIANSLLAPVQASINARYVRRARGRLASSAPLVIGVTGSFGKTSTKFAIAHLLGGPALASATPGSFNTPMGLCRAVNEGLEPHHRFLVAEMGAYGIGDIAELCRLVEPTIGVLTAIGPAHLERFGSIEAVTQAKYEIVGSLPAEGVAVMNVDDLRVRGLADETRSVRVVRYGLDLAGSPDVTARDVSVSSSGTSLTIVTAGTSFTASTRLLGRHAIGHILAAVAVATEAGVPPRDMPARIATLEPVEHRLQLIAGAGGVTVIDDAFNSNPDGAAAALEVLEAMGGKRRIVVTPGIIELGELQGPANRALGAHAARVADVVVVVAPVNRAALVEGAKSAGTRAEVVVVDSLAEATEQLRSRVGPGDVVLFENDLPDHFEA